MKTELNQIELNLEDRLAAVARQGIDAALTLLADVFVQGMHDGIQDTNNGYLMRSSFHSVGLAAMGQQSVPDQQLVTLLTTELNDPESVEFMTMDQLISDIILDRNQVDDWDALYDLADVTLEMTDLMAVFFGGWQFGCQNAIYQYQGATEDDYLQVQDKAEAIVNRREFDDLTAVTSRTYSLTRILTVMAHQTPQAEVVSQ